MKVAVIGHRSLAVKEDDKEIFKAVACQQIMNLIEQHGADTFCFAYRGAFNNVCYDIVTELMEIYGGIKRVYYRAEYDKINDEFAYTVLTRYEEHFYDESIGKAGVVAYMKRNEIMIDDCDVLLTFYDEKYIPSHSKSKKSGTAYAIKYAKRRGKRIINVFDSLCCT